MDPEPTENPIRLLDAPPVILTIAGFDPSSGAGATADLKTIAAHGCYGVAAVTALTVQSTRGVKRVQPADKAILRETLEELASDFQIAAVHIGMLGAAGMVEVVTDFLASHAMANVVADPVMMSSSGAELLDRPGIRRWVERLLPLATVITPNLDEAEVLTGLPVTNLGEMKLAAEKLHALGAAAVVVTGGHLDPAIDLLSVASEGGLVQEEFSAPQQKSQSTHGTGCAFATALACRLAQGRPLPEAVKLAKVYVEAAIANAYRVGSGIGPVNHFYEWRRR